jgi:L-threonylcarbamoyladenylate synthase
VAHAVLQQAQTLGVFGVAAPSANLFGRVSPTTAAHVAGEFGEGLLIVDGGACDVGIESTIVDCTRGVPVLLRPGVLTLEQLSAACGVAVRAPAATDADAPRASGTLASHYAPSAQVRLMEAAELQTALNDLNADAETAERMRVAVWSRQSMQIHTALRAHVVYSAMPQDPVACAHVLFAQLRAFDRQGVAQIWVERPPALSAWAGVLDRLTRAATPAG